MKSKTIKSVCRKKVNEWLKSIEDEPLRELLEKNVIVTGGAIASMLLNEQVNDFDIYFRTKRCAVAAAKYYVSKFQPRNRHGIGCDIHVSESEDRVGIVIQSAGIASEDGSSKPYDYFEAREAGAAGDYVSGVMNDPGEIEDAREAMEDKANEDDGPMYRPVFMSTHAITLSGRLQIVLRFFGEPEDIHKNYDFVHCTNYWTNWDDKVVLQPAALESLLTRELRYVGSRYPICSIIRLRKFLKRGWFVNAGQILKMVMQASQLNLTDPAVLQDQLTGVDAAYFSEVIQKLKEKDPEKINAAYLIEIIDRMF